MASLLNDLGLNSAELVSVQSALKNPGEIGNSSDVELKWAMKAMDHANVHYNLITSVDASRLKLTTLDDQIYKDFREKFPTFVIDKVTEESLKSPAAKEEWREFCESYKGQVADYNEGTLLRLDCSGDYDQDNTIFSVRVQFLAIEIARNKEGFNTPMLGKKETAKS